MLFDKDRSGQIDKSELKDAMRALGIMIDKQQVNDLMEKADKDGTGDIDEEEFKILMADQIKDRDPKAEL